MKTIQEIMDAVAGLDSLNTTQKINIIDDIKLVLIDGTSSQKLEHCNQCLIRLSDERDWNVRRAVAKTLNYIFNPEHFLFLVEKLKNDNHNYVKIAALEAEEKQEKIFRSVLFADKSKKKHIALEGSIRKEFGKKGADAIITIANTRMIEAISSTVHRLQNIKSPIIWNIKYIEKLLIQIDNTDDEILESMKTIKQNMDYFINILNELNKMTTSDYINFEIVNLSSLLEEAIRGVKARIIDKNISWSGEVNVSMDKTIKVEIDRNQMYEVFVNIIKNGIEAQDMEGNISVIVNAQNEDVIVSIQDTGCGIEEYDNDYILDQGITSKQDSGGTGFGLSNAHLFINNHSGELSWDSIPGEGTVMKITIPKRQINDR